MKRFRQFLLVFMLGVFVVTSCVLPGSVQTTTKADTICLSPFLSADSDIEYLNRAIDIAGLPFFPETKNGKMLNPDFLSNQMLMIVQLAEKPEVLSALFKLKLEESRGEVVKVIKAYREGRSVALTPEQQKLVREIELLYAPLAERFGLSALAESLNELCFMLSSYKEWDKTSVKYEETFGVSYRTMAKNLEIQSKKIEQACLERGIRAEVSCRQKKIYSIAEKIRRKSASKYHTIGSLNDIFGIRLVLEQIPEDEEEFMLDLIAMLQETLPVTLIMDQLDRRTISKHGYNGWHIGLDFTNGLPSMEIQIMSKSDLQSYFDGVPRQDAGISAHWAYKVWKKTDGSETFKYLPGLKMSGKKYKDAFYDLKEAADKLGTFVFVRKDYGSIENMLLPPNATAADAAHKNGWLTRYSRELFVSSWKSPQIVRTIRNDEKLKPGDIIIGVNNTPNRLSVNKLNELLLRVADPSTRYFIYSELRKILNQWSQQDKNDLLLDGNDVLERYNIVVNKDTFGIIEKVAEKLDFEDWDAMMLTLAVEKSLGKKDLLRMIINELCFEGMNILVSKYNLNPIDDRIDDLIPPLTTMLGGEITISRREAFFFALALGQVDTTMLEFSFAFIESPLLHIQQTERDVVLTVAA